MTDHEITKADERAVLAYIERRPAGADIDDLRYMLAARLAKRVGLQTWTCPSANRAAARAVPRLLARWKRAGKVSNPVRGRWTAVEKSKSTKTHAARHKPNLPTCMTICGRIIKSSTAVPRSEATCKACGPSPVELRRRSL